MPTNQEHTVRVGGAPIGAPRPMNHASAERPPLFDADHRVRRSWTGERCVIQVGLADGLAQRTRDRLAPVLRSVIRAQSREAPFAVVVATTATTATIFVEGAPACLDRWLERGVEHALREATSKLRSPRPLLGASRSSFGVTS